MSRDRSWSNRGGRPEGDLVSFKSNSKACIVQSWAFRPRMRCSVVLQIFRLHFSFGPTFPSKLGIAGPFTLALRMAGTNRSSGLDGMNLDLSYIGGHRGPCIFRKKRYLQLCLSAKLGGFFLAVSSLVGLKAPRYSEEIDMRLCLSATSEPPFWP